MNRAVQTQRRRQSLQQYLTIVEPSANIMPPVRDQAKLHSEFTQALRSIHIDALASNDPTGKLRSLNVRVGTG